MSSATNTETAAEPGIAAAEDRAQGSRVLVTAALLLAMTVAALEQTVVSTAMPTIIVQLKGLRIYPWVFSAYLLASTVTTPLYGKLADLLGRRRVLLFGLGLFAAGSMLSGLARSMPELIAMRVIQGIGAGAVGPIVLTMLGDLFTLAERAKVQGLFSAVWGVSSLAGPFVGGVLTDQLSWRWVFFVTVPFAGIAMWILAAYVRETVDHKTVPPIDWIGAGLLAGASTSLLLAVLGGAGGSWMGEVGLSALAIVLLACFVVQERRAADPILPLDLIAQRTIAAAVGGSFLIGLLMFGIDTYVPLFVQGVRGGSATAAGRTITPMFVAWSISVAVAAKVVVRLGFRTTALVGTLLIATGSAALVAGAAWPAWAGPTFVAGMTVIGLGMGPTSLSYILSVQHEVEWGRRGVATGAVTFVRTLGGALGVGVLGATLGFELAQRLAGIRGLNLTAALRPETHALLSPEHLLIVRNALGRTLRDVFAQMLGLTLLGLFCASRLPRAHERAGGESAANEDLMTLAAAEP